MELYIYFHQNILLQLVFFLFQDDGTNGRILRPEEVDVSDSESVFDDPKKKSLKSQVRYLQKQKVCHQDKIKKLRQQNRYLKKKVSNLKNFLRALVKKFDLQKHVENAPKVESKIQTAYNNQN